MQDEISLRNVKKESDISFVRSLSKSVGGAFVNELQVSSQDIPGNFGVRMIETMPTNVREVFVQQRNNLELEFKCDYRHQNVPALLVSPDDNDYLTDEESEDAATFEVKVPELSELINQFEEADDSILGFKESQKAHVASLKQAGFEPETRY